MTHTASAVPAPSPLRSVLWAALLAGVLSAAVNGLIWWLLRGEFAAIRVGPPGQEAPFWPGAVPLFSLVGALGAGIVYALLLRLTRAPRRVFVWVASGALLLSFLMPLSIRTPPMSVVAALELMHVVVFAFVLWLMLRRPA